MVDLQSIQFLGGGLQRPECVLCTRAGYIYAADWRGGVSRIAPNGELLSYLSKSAPFQIKPNGIALLPDGNFLLTHLGADDGGVYHLDRQGNLKPFLLEVDGAPLPPTNYVHLDANNRVWITVSTRISPRHLAYRKDNADGFIVMVDDKGARVVADDLGYTNECVVHPGGEWLYVNETFTRRLSRFSIAGDGSLCNKEIITEFGHGVFPDGLTFAEDGSVYVTSIVSNRVIRVDENGGQTVLLEDNDAQHVDWVERAFQASEMGRTHLDQVKSQRLKNISSLAFGGDDLKTAFLGCLLGDQIAYFHSDVAGVPPVHWDYDD